MKIRPSINMEQSNEKASVEINRSLLECKPSAKTAMQIEKKKKRTVKQEPVSLDEDWGSYENQMTTKDVNKEDCADLYHIISRGVDFSLSNVKRMFRDPILVGAQKNSLENHQRKARKQKMKASHSERSSLEFFRDPEPRDVPEPSELDLLLGDANKCHLCKKSFKHPSMLFMHERLHNCCKYCNKKIVWSGNLRDHERTHLHSNRPFSCDVCKKTFRSSNYLRNHERTHTGDHMLKCQDCNMCFTRSGELRSHERTHFKGRVFTCSYCSRVFMRSGDLQNHERTHSGERLFECKFCQKFFLRLGNLRKHERIHTGELLHQCRFCIKTFIRPGYLRRHEATHDFA